MDHKQMHLCPNRNCPTRQRRIPFLSDRGLAAHLESPYTNCNLIILQEAQQEAQNDIPRTRNRIGNRNIRLGIDNQLSQQSNISHYERLQEIHHPYAQFLDYNEHDILPGDNFEDFDVQSLDSDDVQMLQNHDGTTPNINDHNIDQLANLVDRGLYPTRFAYQGNDLVMAELVQLLDQFNAPDSALTTILNWCKKHAQQGYQFNPNITERRAFIRHIRKELSNTYVSKLLPYHKIVHLEGYTEPVVVSCFDFVAHLFNILDDSKLINKDTMDLNWDEPFHLEHMKKVGLNDRRSEAQSGSVFQSYLDTLQNGKDFPLAIILYIDSTHISQNSKFKLCPVMASLAIFTEEARRSNKYWFKLGYIIDHSNLSTTTNNVTTPGQSHRNYHSMLNVCLNRLLQCQLNNDPRCNDVLLIFGTKSETRDIKVPILYLMNDAKEGDIFCNRMLSYLSSEQQTTLSHM